MAFHHRQASGPAVPLIRALTHTCRTQAPLLLIITTLLMINACSTLPDSPTPATPSAGSPTTTGEAVNEWDAQSWQTQISEDCRAFFDGCNQCRREPGASVAACTRKACIHYEKPYCLDSSSGNATSF